MKISRLLKAAYLFSHSYLLETLQYETPVRFPENWASAQTGWCWVLPENTDMQYVRVAVRHQEVRTQKKGEQEMH